MYTRSTGCVYCTFLHYTIIVHVHTFHMLFSSPSTLRMSNSLTHFVSMMYKRDSNWKSVRPCILVVLGVCTVHFFTTQYVILHVHTFHMLFSSTSKISTSNSLTHFVLMMYKRDSNLKSVRPCIKYMCVCLCVRVCVCTNSMTPERHVLHYQVKRQCIITITIIIDVYMKLHAL